jgi:CPA2 family monovalent cation:H+ antiporter-2
VKYLAEFGVVFLMFVIGLEFNLPKLRSMRTLVFGLGLSQVVLTMPARCWPRAAGLAVQAATGATWRCRGRARWCWAAPWPCRPPPSSSS